MMLKYSKEIREQTSGAVRDAFAVYNNNAHLTDDQWVDRFITGFKQVNDSNKLYQFDIVQKRLDGIMNRYRGSKNVIR